MIESGDIYDKLLEGWSKSEAKNGIPYYINHRTERTQWDHPYLVKAMEDLVEMDSIKYAAYRTATKLRFLQKKLKLDQVELSTIRGVFERHGFPARGETLLDCKQLQAILTDVFNLCHGERLGEEASRHHAQVLMHWLLNLYDVNRTGCVRVASVKTGLAALCATRLHDKFMFFFRLLRDHNDQVTRKRLGSFLHDMVQIPEIINESVPFGGLNIGPAVENCFQMSHSEEGMTQQEFLDWLVRAPQTLLWLPTLHRVITAEGVEHVARCQVCRCHPIRGLRYKCLKCFNYDICQQCFFTGRTSRGHKLRHPTQEYCISADSKDNTKAFMKIVRNNLSKKHRNKKRLRYLPIQGTEQPYDLDEFAHSVIQPDLLQSPAKPLEVNRRAVSSPASVCGSGQENKSDEHNHDHPGLLKENDVLPLSGARLTEADCRELESIVHHLDDENRELLGALDRLQLGSETSSERSALSWEREERALWQQEERARLEAQQEILQSHNQQLQAQLQRLRSVLGRNQPSGTNRQPLSSLTVNAPAYQPRKSPNLSPGSYQFIPVQQLPPASESNAFFTSSSLRNPWEKSMSSKPSYQQPIAEASHLSSIYGSVSKHNYAATPQVCVDKLGSHGPFTSTPGQGLHSQHRRLSAPDDYSRLNITSGLSPEADFGRTQYSLPQLSTSQEYQDEEEEMEELVRKLDLVFPEELSEAALNESNSLLDEMYTAAAKIGEAMSVFVGASKSPASQ